MISFFIAVGIMCGMTSVLAVVMIIAEETIANYGELRIMINNEKELLVEGGRPLLSTLKEEEIFIPSACGGRGSCGLCKVKILEGAGSVLPTELPWLDAQEKADGIRVSCQVRVKSDMSIAIPEELFSVRQYETKVLSIRDLTHDIKQICLKIMDPADMEYRAGQFIQFEVPEYELTDEAVYRAYSFSSDPAKKDEIELEIRYVPHGICTTYVFRHLKVGDHVIINGPYGDFTLRENSRDIIFIAGGSGMAPIKSILHEMCHVGNPRKTWYFFGARSKRDLFLVEEMKEIEKKLPSFQFIPALSAPLAEDNWSGETGLITDVVGKHIKSGEQAEAYLCGSPLMIDACVKVLREKGLSEDDIYYDKFA